MEKSVSSVKILNIVICFILLISFVIIGTKITVNAEQINSNADEVLPSIQQLGYSYPKLLKNVKQIQIKDNIVVYDIDYFIYKNIDTIEFFSKMFDYKLEDIIHDLKQRAKVNQTFIETNIGYLKNKKGNLKTYDSFEYGLIEYFYDLNKNQKKLRHVNYEPYKGNSKYIENLIMYYSSIYKNVDYKTILSIGAAESGYYKVKYMLKYNNIYGGMSSNGLIKYNNIELGVLSYVRMMSKYYYGKGLTSISSIGKIYCPVYDNSGRKIASPHWIKLVRNAKKVYNKYDNNITINEIINKKVII